MVTMTSPDRSGRSPGPVDMTSLEGVPGLARTVSVEAMLDDLGVLVSLESPSRDLAALGASARAVAAMIENRLGHPAQLVDSPAGPHVQWRGGGDPKVLILGHHDTVFPLGTVEHRPFAVADGRATGPGVFDMLGGLVLGVHAVGSLADRSGVEILITADEEVGSHASRDLIEERARACGAVLVLEGAGEGGALKIGRKGCGTLFVSITGQAAHAGLEPENGANALVEAAHQVLHIAGLAAPEAGTTVTPTVASAGTTDNVVPAEARITVDIRVESAAEQQRIEAAFAALRPQVEGTAIAVTGTIGRPPMPESASAALYDIARRVQPDVRGISVGGGSDGNFTAALGIATLDGLGAVGGGAHADHEYILVDRMADRAHLIAGLAEQLCRPSVAM